MTVFYALEHELKEHSVFYSKGQQH